MMVKKVSVDTPTAVENSCKKGENMMSFWKKGTLYLKYISYFT